MDKPKKGTTTGALRVSGGAKKVHTRTTDKQVLSRGSKAVVTEKAKIREAYGPRNVIRTGKKNSVTVHFPDRGLTAVIKFSK